MGHMSQPLMDTILPRTGCFQDESLGREDPRGGPNLRLLSSKEESEIAPRHAHLPSQHHRRRKEVKIVSLGLSQDSRFFFNNFHEEEWTINGIR